MLHIKLVHTDTHRIYIYIYIYMNIYLYIYACIYIYIHSHKHIYTSVRKIPKKFIKNCCVEKSLIVQASIYERHKNPAYIDLYIHIYIHTHTHTRLYA